MIDVKNLDEAVNDVVTFNELVHNYIWHTTEGIGAESQMTKSAAAAFNAGLFNLNRGVLDRLRAAAGAVHEQVKASAALPVESR
jgi:hypothetical protein